MTTIRASDVRLGEHFNKIVYHNEMVKISHRNGNCVYVVSLSDWELLQAAKQEAYDKMVNDAAERAFERHGEGLRRLAD